MVTPHLMAASWVSGRMGDSSASNLVTNSRLRMSLTAVSLSSVSLM